MDHELPDEERQKIIAIASHHHRGSVQRPRTAHAVIGSSRQFIQMHIVLDPRRTLMDAHWISDEVEAAIQADFPNADIIIHQDPDGVARIPPASRRHFRERGAIAQEVLFSLRPRR